MFRCSPCHQHILRVLADSPTWEEATATLGINPTNLRHKRRRYQMRTKRPNAPFRLKQRPDPTP